MKWFCNVLSWHFACLALALLVLGSTAITAKVAADSPPPSTSITLTKCEYTTWPTCDGWCFTGNCTPFTNDSGSWCECF